MNPEQLALDTAAGQAAAAADSAIVWLSVSELAIRHGLTKSTISEKVSRFAADGQLVTRPGKGRTKLVNAAEFARLVGQHGDAAREHGARVRLAAAAAEGAGEAPIAPAYRDAQTREKAIRAEILELDLAERLGKVLAVDDVVAAVVAAAELLVRIIDRMPGNAEAMLAAAQKDGLAGVRAVYKADARALREAASGEFAKLAEHVTAKSPAPAPATHASDQAEAVEGRA